MSDQIERLRTLGLHYGKKLDTEACWDICVAAETLERLQSQRDRYRTALEYIVGSSEPSDEPQAKGMAQIARKALSDE